MTAGYGWVDDPEPWPPQAEFSYGAVVIAPKERALRDRELVVVGYDASREGEFYGVVTRDDDRDGWSLPASSLTVTGKTDIEFAGPRVRPVLGEGTLVTVGHLPRYVELGIAGALGETRGLWWAGNERDPAGYTVWVFHVNSVYMLGWDDFAVVAGKLSDSSDERNQGP